MATRTKAARGSARRGNGDSSGAPRRGSGGFASWRMLRLALGGIVLAGLLAVGGLVGLFVYYGSDPHLPAIESLRDYRPKQVTRLQDRNGALVAELGVEKRTFVPYAEIPKILVNSVIAAEDADYWNHGGFDYRGMLRAFIENVLRGRRAQGGSTITQQVVKTFLLSPERTMRRKVQEIILARRLSDKLSKEQILELYLNQIYYGHGRYGCEEAARFYFGKSVRQVDVAEAALLAGLPQSPERLSPRKHPEAAKTRQRYVLGRLAELGFIDAKTVEKLAKEPIRIARDSAPSPELAAEAVESVSHWLSARFQGQSVAEMGLTVQTTIDAKMQAQARQALERGLEELDVRQGYRGPVGHVAGKALAKHKAALEALRTAKNPPQIYEGIVERIEKHPSDPRLGQLFVDLGGQLGVADLAYEPRYTKGPKPLLEKFTPGDLVRVRFAPERARGSSHGKGDDKAEEDAVPLALELGPQAAMVVMNPTSHQILAEVGGYDFRPGGFNRAERAVRLPGSAFKPILYAAAIESRKFTAASIVNDAPDVYDRWKPQNYEKEEFRGPVRVRVALAHSINTVAIKLLEQVGIPAVKGMATRVGITSPIADDVGLALALGATTVHPLEMANVYATFASGGMHADPQLVTKVGDEAITPPPAVAAIPADVAYVTVSLMRSVIQEGTAAAALKLRRPAAGKTGTSNALRDAWFVGFTPDLLAAVWVGFDDQRKLGRGEAGAKTALPIWMDFMAKATASQPVRDFTPPPGVVVQRIDKATGLLPAPGKEVGADSYDEVFLPGTVPTEVAPAAGHEQSADELLMGQ
ncbi:MAG TPA: PBP1A family penicillin-binding protein [Polyangia bacterium]|nr:PBP1A family penicillin-binding protein [Polyangia bacterium]